MAHNLTITISEELWQAIERWRDQLTLSRICQQALAKEINRLEMLPKEVREMEKVVERLRAEKGDFKAESYRAGFEDGIAWAKKASYKELLEWADTASISGLVLDNWVLPEELEEEDEDEKVVDEPRYQRGWLDGVLKVWKTVKTKI